MLSLPILALFLVLYSRPVLSQWALSRRENAQFITYSGLVSGIYRHPQGQLDQGCPDYNLGPHNYSYLYIGRYANDANPFFFELYHDVSASTTTGIISYTTDSIYNLEFTSVGHPCMKNGYLCGSYVSWPWYYINAEMLDLGMGTGQSKAVMERVQVGDKMGYRVSGDQTSFIGNGTIHNSVNIARPPGLTAPTGCMGQLRHRWNSSIPFTYNLTFTQTSASMSLYSSTTQGTLTLSFEGTMNRTTVELYTTDPNVPTFNASWPTTTLPSATQTGRSSSGRRESRHLVSLQIYAVGALGISLLM